MEHIEGIEDRFVNSMVSNNLSEITIDIAEAGIDQLLSNEFLKEIPILGAGFKLFAVAKNISESFFKRKILMFLFHLKDVPQEKRMKFISELNQDEKSRERVGEKILIILNQLDDSKKAAIIGKLFKAAISGHIEYSAFLRLSRIVDKVFIDDLAALKENHALYKMNDDTKENLATAGILKQVIQDNRSYEETIKNKIGRNVIYPPTFEYHVNSFGKLLIDYGW
ncbi:hypothetical protein [Chitinophaga polysaccharea]|uniref:hypothetical protein n=1 Tax=Chitinophaga polysaccharea TaxID=1293035 RepID=UPI0011590DCB|nr:hypothetical protein [Chitinophaga polysaccharea]